MPQCMFEDCLALASKECLIDTMEGDLVWTLACDGCAVDAVKSLPLQADGRYKLHRAYGEHRHDELVREAADTGLCPLCGSEIEKISSGHERDSSQDRCRCSSAKCKFECLEPGAWLSAPGRKERE